MSTISLAEPDLVHACRILFGADLHITSDFLEYIQLSGVKSAYRRKALETHPDRLAARGGEELSLGPADLFRQVQQAYQDLTSYLEARERGDFLHTSPFRGEDFKAGRQKSEFRRPHSQARPTANSKDRFSTDRPETLYKGSLPQRPLLFGHFLYYSGLITWRMIIQALLWQRTQRPRLGQLGQRFGWLSTEDILEVLRDSRVSRPFGQTALDMGLLNERQLKLLLFQQKRLQKKIGEFFLREKILTPAQLNDLLARYQEHNSRLAAAVFHHRF